MTPRFDPTRAIVYDLARGQLRDDEGTPRLNLPAHLLLRLCEEAGEQASQDFAQSLGSELGRRIADRLGQSTNNASVEAWAEHLGGQLALLGLGDLSIEQWGKALVLQIKGAPEDTDSLLTDLLGAALQRAVGRDATLVAFPVQDGLSLLVVSAATSRKVESLIQQGAGLGQVVERLHEGAA